MADTNEEVKNVETPEATPEAKAEDKKAEETKAE